MGNEFVHVNICNFVVSLDDTSAEFRHNPADCTISSDIDYFYLADVRTATLPMPYNVEMVPSHYTGI
jgi:hypothetical protein